MSYEELRDECIKKYRSLYKDTLVFDYCEVPKEMRMKILEDPIYVSKTKALRAALFEEQLNTINEVLALNYAPTERQSDMSSVILKALEMKQKLLLSGAEEENDDTSALNVAYVPLSKESYLSADTVEVQQGNTGSELGADFALNDDTDSFESRMKADIQEKLSKMKDTENTRSD